ncbi:MAG TPA: YbhB/YbcL family Raf kinase inhibitor-like protein [Nevskiaceae bacterium]|nr:YbhB/YbcL family Raf kinase inhibitor-like protein [Nevskiaceae bacterium]
MLQIVPSSVGRTLSGLRAGLTEVVYLAPGVAEIPETISVTSAAFGKTERLPQRYTADGEGLSPPLAWSNVPETTQAFLVLVEDADSPSPRPLVHAIAWGIAGDVRGLPEAALNAVDGATRSCILGLNSTLRRSYLPPDPPPGHGDHQYLFQVYALDQAVEFDEPPGRSAIVDTVRGLATAKGCLVGIYSRD